MFSFDFNLSFNAQTRQSLPSWFLIGDFNSHALVQDPGILPSPLDKFYCSLGIDGSHCCAADHSDFVFARILKTFNFNYDVHASIICRCRFGRTLKTGRFSRRRPTVSRAECRRHGSSIPLEISAGEHGNAEFFHVSFVDTFAFGV